MKNLMLSTFLVLVWLCSHSACSETVYVHSDILGSPIMETNSSGTVTSRSHYKPFGEALEGMKKGVGYTGHLNDKDLKLTYMQARYYDPVIGRFYSNDPLGFRDVHSFNRYAYANNNPYKYTDPDGNNPKLIADFALNVAINYATTGSPGLASAAAATIEGALNPMKTVEKVQKLKKLYVTYTKTNKKTGEVYSGRTSGTGDAADILKKRDGNHHKNSDGFGPAEVDKVSDNKSAIRGREQQLIDANGGSKSQGGTSGNAINGISDKNPKKQGYIDAANKEL